ncbi:MAG: hypothetical protein R8P61_16225 [Bacteroidia bacterium]|nr:hypothetical protein [Bacteroidia bacterium]
MAVKKQIEIEKAATYSGHRGSVFALALDESHTTLFSSGDDGVVAAWDLEKKEDQGKGVLKTESAIYSLLCISEQDLLLAGGSNGSLYLIDTRANKLIQQFRKADLAIYHIHYDPGSDHLYVLFAKGFLSILQLKSFKEIYFNQISENHLRSLVQLGQELYIGSSDGKIRVMDALDGHIKQSWEAHENSVFSLAYHEAGKYLISGGRDAQLNVWDQQSKWERIHHLPAHNFTINDIDFSPDADYIVTGSRDKTFKIWDAYNLQLLKVIDHVRYDSHFHSVNKVKWLKYSKYSLISCSDDRMIHRWLLRINT